MVEVGGHGRGEMVYLVRYYGSARCAGVCRDDHTAIVDASYDCRAGGCRFGKGMATSTQGGVSRVEAKVEARHRGGGVSFLSAV